MTWYNDEREMLRRHRSLRVVARVGFVGAVVAVVCLAIIGAFFLAGAITGLFL